MQKIFLNPEFLSWQCNFSKFAGELESTQGLREAGVVHQDCNNHFMPADSNLDTLMARYQLGDFDAATALIETASPQLHRFFLAQLYSRTEADDLLQETWLRIHRVRHTYRPGEPMLPWAYAIARRVRVDHFRKTARTTARHEDVEDMSTIAGPTLVDANRSDGLAAMLALLSDGEREVVEMLKVAGLSLEEVARATSCTVGSVKQKAHRAYKKLRVTLIAAERNRAGKGRSEGLS
jgi:RNA polymerase sigma-70 factor (ECF subfamily)